MNNNYLHEIKKRLSEVEAKENKRDSLKGFYLFISALCTSAFSFSLLEAVFKFDSTPRSIFFFFLIISFMGLLGRLVFFPLLKSYFNFAKHDHLKTAAKIGNKFHEIKDELTNALQLVNEKSGSYSSQLVDAAFERVYKRSQNINFTDAVDFNSTKKYLRTSLITLGAAIFIFIVFPGLSSAAYRIINYNKIFTPPQKFIFEIKPGNAEITKGDNIAIVVKTIGEQPSEIILSTKSEEQTDFVEKKLAPDSLGNFNFESIAVKSSFEYFASAEGIESDLYKISVINRPVITNFEAEIIPPAYSKLPSIIQKDNGSITALAGSKVKIKINSSRELSDAAIEFGGSTKKSMSINYESASAEFSIHSESDYRILIKDLQGFSNVNLITYSIKILADEPPSIEMISPDQNVKLGTDGKISLVTKIADDYGFGALNLNYKLSASKYRTASEEFTSMPIPINKNLKEDEVYYVWDLAPLILAEGETLSYYLEIFDNDNVNGPKSAKTLLFTIQVPSIDELFAQADNTQQDAAKDLAETLEEAEKLNQEIQKINSDLKQNSREISWQEKERAEKAADKFKELTNKVEDVSQKLSGMQKELMQNNLISEETLQKYNELQDLLDQFNSEDLKEALKRMQDSLQSLMRDKVQMSLEELKANEEYFKKSIERTLNLLKRIQAEQKVDELIKRTEDISEKLDELQNKTEQNNLNEKSKRDELSKRQNDLSNNLENMKDEMEKLNEKMNELSDMPKEEMEKLLKEFEKQNNRQLSQEAQQNLQQMQKNNALQNQQQLSQNMQSMKNQLQSLQSAMQQKNQMQTFYEMMKILDDLVTLSKDQEELKNNTNKLSPASPELRENSRLQSNLQSSLSRVLQNMGSLSQKSFAITPEMGKALGEAYSQMQQSIGAMQNQNAPLAAQMQGKAMSHLNEAANLVKGGIDQMMSGGQGGGMMSLMQQLQQMAQQQMNLNQLTQMMNQGQMTQQMLAQMQQLAQQQETIRKSLEELNREARESGESKRLAANLEKILNEMKEVVTNLQTQKLDDELVKQQEKILSRLLDAQRSINERDFEKNRKSDTGKNIPRTSPPELILSTDEGKNKLKDELMKAIREGYKKDYEELIRKYLEELQK